MSRTVLDSVTTQAAQAARYPMTYAIMRDMRIRFLDSETNSPWHMPVTPWGQSDGDLLKGNTTVFQDSCTFGTSICRVANASNASDSGLYVNFVADPTQTADWDTWTKITDSDQFHTPGIVRIRDTMYIWYMHGQHLHIIQSTDGVTWGSDNDVDHIFIGNCALAPINDIQCYVAIATSNGIALYRIEPGVGVSECPWRIYGNNSGQPINASSFDSISFFDAYTMDGVDGEFVLITHGTGGQVYKTRYWHGVWSPPQTILPTFNDDTNGMLAYRVTIINDGARDVAWLTARVERILATQTIKFDIYLRSLDGWNWTHLTRNSFICVPQVGGKLECSGDYLYYTGLTNVYRAKKPYGVDGSDPASLKVAVTNDFMSGSVSFPQEGTAPQVELDLAAGASYYLRGQPAAIVKRGSEIWIYGGYKDSDYPTGDFVMLDHAGLDSVKASIANGGREFSISARDMAFKSLRSWVSPLFWDFRSQNKWQGTDNLAEADGHNGDWTSTPATAGSWRGAPFNPNGSDPGSDLVFAADSAKLGFTRNFTEDAPVWDNITGTLSGTIIDFCLDPWDTAQFSHQGTVLSVMYTGTSTGLSITRNAKSYAPTWALLVDAIPGVTLDQFHNVRCTIAQQDIVYTQVIAHVDGTYYLYVGMSQDMGAHWEWSQVGALSEDPTHQFGFACSQYIPGNVYCGMNGSLYRSTDFGMTWYSVGSFGSTGPSNIVLPYLNNPDDLIIYVAGVV